VIGTFHEYQGMHIPAEPSILYFGTPVALLSTLNKDGSANLAPMSSVWWLGGTCCGFSPVLTQPDQSLDGKVAKQNGKVVVLDG
jgi:flavin reductase (DIM6/NTAB) family NADH-FMN oxidoreductase RutF